MKFKIEVPEKVVPAKEKEIEYLGVFVSLPAERKHALIRINAMEPGDQLSTMEPDFDISDQVLMEAVEVYIKAKTGLTDDDLVDEEPTETTVSE